MSHGNKRCGSHGRRWVSMRAQGPEMPDGIRRFGRPHPIAAIRDWSCSDGEITIPEHLGSQLRPKTVAQPSPTTEEEPQKPHVNDVLCGRGVRLNRHVGNVKFRALVSANMALYGALPKSQKTMLTKKIVEIVHSQNPPGRFLQKDPQTDLWFDAGMKRSLEKTSQALREREKTSAPARLTKAPLAKASTCSTSDVPEITIPEHLIFQFRPKTSQALREEIPFSTTTPTAKSPLAASVSPGESTYTTIATMDSFSDIGVSAPTLSPKSPPPLPLLSPGSATSSLTSKSYKRLSSKSAATDVPGITIPVESYFHSNNVERASPCPHGPPPHLPVWDYRHHPPAPHPVAHPHHPYYPPSPPPPPPPPHNYRGPPLPHPYSPRHDPYYHHPLHGPPPPPPPHHISPIPPHYAHDFLDARLYHRSAHPYPPDDVPTSPSRY